jgi:hypothetical protein
MFEEGKRKQREWSTRQEQMRHSLIQQNQEYCYPPAHESMVDDSQVSNSSAIHNHDIPAYSNTDVSSMHLNNNNTTTSPSIVASTNIIDPNMMNEEDMSTVNDFHQEPSTTASVNNSQSDYSNTRRQMMSPSPSYQSHIVQQPERTSSIMDREQIRRHLAPGQAVLTNRNSSSVVTLDSAINRSFTSPNLAHHRSKEYVTQHTNVPLTSSSPTMTPPLANTTTVSTSVYNYNTEDLTSKLTESSIISTDAVDFPHDSDRFSIRSDVIPTSTESPTTILPSTSSKSRNRPLLKKIIWG